MLTVPLQAVPNQTLKVVLGGQNCQIAVWQRGESMFVDVNSDGVDIVTNVIARDVDLIVCRQYADLLAI